MAIEQIQQLGVFVSARCHSHVPTLLQMVVAVS
jgi:hypothetical protein